MIAQSLHSFTACIGCWKIWFQNFWEPEATAPAQCTINYNKSSRTPRPLLKENLDTPEIGNILKFIWQRMLQTRFGWEKTTHDLKNKTVTTPKAKFLSFLWSKLSEGEKKNLPISIRVLMTEDRLKYFTRMKLKNFTHGGPTEVSSSIYNCSYSL